MTQVLDSQTERRTDWPVQWEQHDPGEVLDCAVVIEAEEEGGFVVFARDLPGVVSQGETFEEALEAIKDALSAAIQSYKWHHESIPWTHPTTPASGNVVRRILINV